MIPFIKIVTKNPLLTTGSSISSVPDCSAFQAKARAPVLHSLLARGKTLAVFFALFLDSEHYSGYFFLDEEA